MPEPTTDRPPPTVDRPLAAACQSFHVLGPRAFYELAVEVEAAHPAAAVFFRRRIITYNRLDPDVIRALTGPDGFPLPPIHVI